MVSGNDTYLPVNLINSSLLPKVSYLHNDFVVPLLKNSTLFKCFTDPYIFNIKDKCL